MNMFRRLVAGIVASALACASLAVSTSAPASPDHHSSQRVYGSCRFEMYHDYNSGWAKAETWNKGGCSEVWAKINYNGTDTAWQVDTRTARASVSGGHISFQGSVGMARLLGGGLSPANDFF